MFKFFQKAVGHAVRVDPKTVSDQISPYLIPGEKVYLAFKEVRDITVFTQHRIIILDVRGIGVQKGIKSIPYRAIQRFEIRTSGAIDINTELMIWVTQSKDPTYVILFASGDKNLLKVQKIIATGTLLKE